MEERMVKFYSKENNNLALHAIPGHFATSHSHINYYIDVTSMKARVKEAKEAAKVLYQKTGNPSYRYRCMYGQNRNDWRIFSRAF